MQANQPPLVVLQAIAKSFGVVCALDGVDLSIAPAEVLALVGENGAGKSTLMRILEGVVVPDEGTITVDGRQHAFREPRDAHALGLRVIHQEPEIVPWLTVAENIFLGRLPRRGGALLDWAALDEQAREALDRFGVGHELRPRQLCSDLGPAQRQMIEIIRAVTAGGRLLAFDEPTSSLTDEEARRLFAVIETLKRDGVAVIYISHRLKEVLDLTDRIVVLRDGRVVASMMTAETDIPAITRAMVGRDIADLFGQRHAARGRPVLEIAGLVSDAIHDVSLTLHAGEILGIGGLMGAGRSELARAIVGFDRRRSGTIRIDGQTLRPNSPADAISHGIGLAPEDRKHEALLMVRSILDNAALCIPERTGVMGFFSRSRALGIVEPLARKMAIKALNLDQPVSRLSGGNQQKVVLARWLAVEPKVLILDEPTRGIDVGSKAEIYDLVSELAQAGIGIILISSEMTELLGLADRVAVMAGGRITGMLEGDAVTESAVLALAMPDASSAHKEIA